MIRIIRILLYLGLFLLFISLFPDWFDCGRQRYFLGETEYLSLRNSRMIGRALRYAVMLGSPGSIMLSPI